jgi:hypothetical protein
MGGLRNRIGVLVDSKQGKRDMMIFTFSRPFCKCGI